MIIQDITMNKQCKVFNSLTCAFCMIWFALSEWLQLFDFKLIKNPPETNVT